MTEIKIYILYGHWDTVKERGAIVAAVSLEEADVERQLEWIAADKAEEYCQLEESSQTIKEQGNGYFKMYDIKTGSYVGFYITEVLLKMSEKMAGNLYRMMRRKYLKKDVGKILEMIYEDGKLTGEEYEKVSGNEEIVNAMIRQYEEEESGSCFFNVNLAMAVTEILGDFV